MEEASVAGESPDRSKQRESSEEPTSGSAGPVPEARTEASERRDPRLAVAREDAKRSAGSGAGSGGGVDTATRVLSVRETEAEDSGEDEDAAGTAEAPEAPEGDRVEPTAGNDGRLRDAVAAWVATADERAAANARLEDPRDGDDADGEQIAADTETDGPQTAHDAAPGPATDSAGIPTTDADAAPGSGAGSTTDPATGTASGAGSAADTDADTGSDSAPDAEAAPASGTDTDPGTGSGPDTAVGSGSAADADTVASNDAGTATRPASGSGADADSPADTDADPDLASDSGSRSEADSGSGSAVGTDTDPGTGTGTGTDTGTGTGTDTAVGSDSAPDADTTAGNDADTATRPASGSGADADPSADTDADPDSDAASGAGSAVGTDTDPGTDADLGTGTGTDTALGSGSAADTGADAASGSGSAPDADTAVGNDAGTGAGAATRAASGSPADADADADPASDAGSRPEADAASGAGGASGASGPERGAGADPEGRGGEDEGDGGRKQVDQPTAVFKAPRPAVDQPTTMLKLGDAAAAADKARKAGEAGDAERTSKFVALRNPDDPATRRPPGAPEAPRAQTPPGDASQPSRASRTGTTTAVPHVGPDRTTQQPLPPKPPLDLLAELTNTPPPPETPLRTTVRRVKIWTPLVILLLIVFGVVQSMRPLPAPTLDLTAQDSFTFDGGKPEIPWPSSGQAALDVQGIGSFGSSGDQKPVPIASVAKVMTAYVILRDHPLKSGADGPKIKIDQAAEDQSQAGQESTVNVSEGDSVSQREALESILIASANNVARLLARWDAGSEKAFVEKMNAAAKDLRMANTTYTDPSGLNNTTVSTAVDQVKLAKEAMKEPAFREVAAMMSYDDYKGVNHSNWNHLVGHNDVVGIKTGTTTSALGNLVFAAKKEVGGETRTIVGAVVRQPAGGADNTILGAALDSSDQLIRAAQDILKSSTILKKGTVVGYVDDGLGGRTPVVATRDVKAVGWAGLTVKLTFDADEVPHTAPAGTKVGTLTVGDGGTSGAVKVPVALRDELVEPGLSAKLTRLG
ncbi:D-alanyl-D-alanine carboxypeptidase [Streptomyces violaceorubidus]